jgi:pentatricopeptide repeat protein
MEEASKFFAEMQEHGFPLDAAVYTCMITGYGNTKKLDKAYVLLQEMKEKGIPHDWRAYNALIKVMAILQKPDEATKLYEKMIQCGFPTHNPHLQHAHAIVFHSEESRDGFCNLGSDGSECLLP